ncbi:hypothetical protein EZV62_004475 [Acer yangbiense]|uniref:NB-ARC domain-containing protein n=1 Tax=Acer yangbiense TaxID=1000413 RepID=A0A5C7IK07_9ROSI|nr:hypothetical protein EZV62_004475 [Acer yangbiense]
MAETVISVAAEIAAEHVVDSISTQLGYIWNYKTNFENLEGQRQKLEGTRAQVQHSVDEAKRKGKEIEQKVLSWLDRVGTINKEATVIIDDNQRANMRCFKSLCPDLKKRYQHSKKAAFKAKDVSEVEKEGNSLGKVSYRTHPKEPWDQFLLDYEDFESRRSIVENVLKELSNSDVDMVGIYGMGGAGKTTLARVVGKRAEKDELFDVVVFVEASETPDVRNIQGAIADKLGLKLHEETDSGRANKLCEQLQKGRKILLILDNIWEGGLDLKKVGIPFGCNHGAYAWDLFQKVAGACIEQHDLQSLASEVAKKCGGLPIAIVTIAKALKGKPEHAWRTALLELERPSLENLGSVTAEAYSCIRLSYNHLNSNELKSIFLLCCTLGFTSDHSVEGLLRYGMGLNLLNTVCSMGEARNRVNTLIQDLKNFSLLLEAFEDERFSIHDVVRDVGRAIAINDHNNYTVNDDRSLQDLAEKNALKNCTSIILHDIAKLPEVLDCLNLKFLYVKPKTRFFKIPDNFFKGMPNLGVLHLIEMVLSPLPASFHLLKKLQTLYLDRCHLRDIAEIGNLTNLKILVLSSDIERLPEQLGELTQLKVLDLRKCSDIEVIPPNSISRLTQLEELYMPDRFDQYQVEGVDGERSNVSLGELEHLSQLTALQIYIPDAKLIPKGLLFQKLQRYKIYIGGRGWRLGNDNSRKLVLKYDDANISVEDGIIKQLKEIEDLQLIGKQGVKNVIYELNRDGFPKLKHFDVESNPELVYIVDFPKQSEPCVAFPHLQTLFLIDLSSLEKICHGQFTLIPNSFCQLRTIRVERCVKLKNIFSSSIARHLSQLERIEVFDCENMEEIFSIVGSENEEIVLEKLESLDLGNLPKLRSFTYDEEEVGSTCDEERQMKDSLMPLFDGKVKFRNLKTIYLWKINLKYVFSSSTLGSFVQLKRLEIDNCTVLEEIIRINDLKNNVELPSLEKLESLDLRNLPKLRSFSYEEEVGSTSDEERQMKDTLMPLFDGKVKFRNLKTIYLEGINLKYVFSSSTLGSFVQLQCLYIDNYTVLEEIIRIDHDLKNNVELPSLTNLKIEECPAMKSFIFSDKVTFPSLEEIKISDMDNLEMIWQTQFEDSLNLQCYPKLSKMTVTNCQSLKNLFPASIARNLSQLKQLYVKNCGINAFVFGDKVTFPSLEEIKSLYVTGLGNLKQIWKQDSKVDTILQNLESLVVRTCGSLVTLLPPSTSFQNLTVLRVQDCRLITLISSSTAKSLMQLKEMEIKDCNMMAEVVIGDGAGMEDEINFKNLKSLELISLSTLRRFCSGNYNFNFPSLEILKVENCPKISIFCSKATNTPMLRKIELDWESYYCNGDVNKTMERIHEKKVFSSRILILSANEIKMILQKFPEHKFSKVQTLEVFHDESTVFPLDILQRFQNLNQLQLSDTSYKEIFSCEEVEKHAETLAQIKHLRLDKLDDLEQMWKQDSGSDLILHKLKSLEVVECNSLITLVPTSASFQNLGYMEISGCNGLINLVTATVAKSLVQLKSMWIENCNEMTEIVANGDVKEDKIIFNKLWTLELTDLSNLTSFYSGNYILNFPSLNELQVTRCPKMKFFSSRISSTPMLQQIEWGSSSEVVVVWIDGDGQSISENVENSTEDCAGDVLDVAKVAEQGLFTLTKRSGKGTWLEDGSELKPCWSKTNFDEIDESKGFITFSLTNGPEYHVSQVRKFEDIYDVGKFIKSLDGVVKVVRDLPDEISIRSLAVVKVPNRVTEDHIVETIQPIVQAKGNIRLATYFPSVNMRKSAQKSNLDLVACLGMFGTLELQPDVNEVVDCMAERLRTLRRKSDGQFIAIIYWSRQKALAN